MAPQIRWKSTQGRDTVAQIVKKLVPRWKNGLHAWQLDLVGRILDGEDLLCCIATGAGKSALFSVPIIVLRELARNPGNYPNLPVRTTFPVGLVITPTKGLAANIVSELANLDVPAFPYCQDTISKARINGRDLVKEIQECKTWNIICLDPEHLRDKAWREITGSSTFSANVVYGCVDEAHLINEWGTDFRPLFKHIGALFRGRLPSHISVFAMSATIQPGAPMKSITDSLGMFDGAFHLYRSSNERPNTQFIMEPLENGIGGRIFPQLLVILNSGRKTVIHCRTIDDVLRVLLYLWKCLPPGPHRLRRLQMYHSLRSYEDNEAILRWLDEDPECQVVIATIAFANGLNIRALLDSITLGFPENIDQLWQEAGRVGRSPETMSRAMVLYQPRSLAAAEKQLAGPSPANGNKGKTAEGTKPMEHAKALVLAEKTCYIAAINRIYKNPPLELTTLDCIAAERRLPCSLCAARNNIELDFPTPPLPRGTKLPPFTAPPTEESLIEKKFRLTKKEREECEPKLIEFGQMVYRGEHRAREHRHRPRSSYFPDSIVSSMLNNLLVIESFTDLEPFSRSWAFAGQYRVRLYSLLQELRATILDQREQAKVDKAAKAKATRQSKKAAAQPDSDSGMDVDNDAPDDTDSDADRRSSPIPPPPKRTKSALKETTNTPSGKPKKAAGPKAANADANLVGKITSTFAAPYRTSGRDRAARRGNR
ncbi:P-loop containing nucleoside triphosphate hydrolase protein [Favolaschia claudopus]|uniref:DNA 3'-5' helicase n=1 Tax=Favolaschia claudopus TaxID=2862362 RepID=A0AAV9ZMV6_9AGAR